MAVRAMIRGLVVGVAAVVAASCASPAGETAPRPATVDIPPAPSSSAPPPARDPGATVVADDAPLGDGLQTFEGMVRPTKGGLDVRGVLLEDDALPRALGPAGRGPLLGARVAITADLVRHEAPAPPPDGLAVQTRSGSWLGVRRVERATIVASPVVVEGEIRRSKGLLAIGDHLVSKADLDWSLAAAGGWKDGDRVRLWGQPRVVRCGPHEQCLIGGTIPMFDVGRAEKLTP